jgi:hypothetical protein
MAIGVGQGGGDKQAALAHGVGRLGWGKARHFRCGPPRPPPTPPVGLLADPAGGRGGPG